jgi:ribonuclease P protein component
MAADKMPQSPEEGSVSPSLLNHGGPSQQFGKNRRVLAASQFSLILKKGHYASDSLLVVNALPRKAPLSPEPPTSSLPQAPTAIPLRIGITIPKKTGNAVKRNHWKRLIREAFRRLDLPRLLPNLRNKEIDVIVRPKRGAQPNYAAVEHSLLSLLRRVTRE